MLINLYYNRSKLAFIFSLLLFLLFQPLNAQGSGSIRGKILDKDTGDPLTGANVFVQNTSVGAASDLDGNFYIPTIPAGQQTLVISYIGYHKLTVEVNVTANQTLEVKYELEAEVLPGQEVLVTAQAAGQIEAINQQLSSNTIKNVVSETRIQELPDFNAAETIGRLPGVSTQRSSGEGNKVVIRGLSPKHNLIAINHLELGATGKDDRSVDLTMITPQMLKAVEVFKAITPDMDGDALGGYVNLQLREAPSGLHTDLLWQSGYTKFNSKYDNYKAVGQVSNRFFDDRLGVFLLGNIEQVARSSDNFKASYEIQGERRPGEQYAPVYITTLEKNRHLDTRKRYGANLIIDYELPGGSIMAINFLSRLNSDYTDFTTNYNAGVNRLEWTAKDGNNDIDIITNAIQGNNDLGFMSIDYSISSNYSRNNDPKIGNFVFWQEGAVPSPRPNAQPEILVDSTKINFESSYLYRVGMEGKDYKENRYTSNLNLKFPFNFVELNTSGFLQVGGKYRYTKRLNDESGKGTTLYYGGDAVAEDIIQDSFDPDLRQDTHNQNHFFISNFTNQDASTYTDFLSNRFGDLVWAPQLDKLYRIVDIFNAEAPVNQDFLIHSNWFDVPATGLRYDYNFIEKYSAAYAMTELNFGHDIMLLGGVRYENDDREFTGYQMLEAPVSTPGAQISQFSRKVTSPANNHFFLPMVHLKYKITEWIDVRYAYTQTLSRPDFIALNPGYFINNSQNFITAGNPKLKPAESFNHDVVVSLYNNEIGLFTSTAFYKSIDNLIWQTQYLLQLNPIEGFLGLRDFSELLPSVRPNVQTYVNNKYKAEIYGVEFDWQTRFWYAPFPINGIVLNVNYSHIWSNTKYSRPTVRRIAGVATFVDTFRVGRVQDTPADILNASFGYDYKGFSGRVSFLYWGSVISYVGRRDEVDSRTKDYFRIDVAVRQKLPLEGLQLYLNLNNINERKDEATQKTIDAPTNQQYYGFTADLGIRYTL